MNVRQVPSPIVLVIGAAAKHNEQVADVITISAQLEPALIFSGSTTRLFKGTSTSTPRFTRAMPPEPSCSAKSHGPWVPVSETEHISNRREPSGPCRSRTSREGTWKGTEAPRTATYPPRLQTPWPLAFRLAGPLAGTELRSLCPSAAPRAPRRPRASQERILERILALVLGETAGRRQALWKRQTSHRTHQALADSRAPRWPGRGRCGDSPGPKASPPSHAASTGLEFYRRLAVLESCPSLAF